MHFDFSAGGGCGVQAQVMADFDSALDGAGGARLSGVHIEALTCQRFSA
jgi:hypothetical protein